MIKLGILLCAALFAACAGAVAAADFRVFTVGDMEIVALADVESGRSAQNRPELLIGLGESDAERLLVPGAMANSINCFLLRKDDKAVLFDTGLGSRGNGQILKSLAAAGVRPEEIDAVVITHFHFDHVGGLTQDGKAVFPNAELITPRMEVEKNGGSADAFLSAYSNRTEFDWGEEIFPGVTAIDAHGHTPGHTAYLLQSAGKQLLVIADLIHFAAIQLPLPDVAVTYDTDPVQAVAARRELFDRAVREGLPVAGMHLSFPGIGMLAKEGAGYRFNAME